jgi:hypothetical protein
MTPEQVDTLLTFGQMALEQGWYDQAREYFEQVLALDASNREAMKGLARVNEILSRREAAAIQPPTWTEIREKPPYEDNKERSLTQWFKRQSRRSRIAILAGVPLLFLCLCLSLVSVVSPTPEPTPTATPIPPTATPIPPTATPIPPTATPGISPQERAYALEIIELLEEHADLSDKISVLQDQASKDPALFSDESWLQDVSITVAAMQRCGQRIRELVPPVRFEEAHQDLVEATRHHDRSNALFMQGVEELNPDKAFQALLELKLANQYMARSTVKLKQSLQP